MIPIILRPQAVSNGKSRLCRQFPAKFLFRFINSLIRRVINQLYRISKRIVKVYASGAVTMFVNAHACGVCGLSQLSFTHIDRDMRWVLRGRDDRQLRPCRHIEGDMGEAGRVCGHSGGGNASVSALYRFSDIAGAPVVSVFGDGTDGSATEWEAVRLALRSGAR